MNAQPLYISNKRQNANGWDMIPHKKRNISHEVEKEGDFQMEMEINTEESQKNQAENKNNPNKLLIGCIGEFEKQLKSAIHHLKEEMNDLKVIFTSESSVIKQKLDDQASEINELKQKLKETYAETALSKVSY